MVLRTKLAELLEKAAAIPPEALARAEAEAEPPSPRFLLAQAESLRNRIAAAKAKANEIEATERQTELLEKALELWRAISEVRARYERAASEAARAELLAQLESLRRECAVTLTRVRLVPEVLTV